MSDHGVHSCSTSFNSSTNSSLDSLPMNLNVSNKDRVFIGVFTRPGISQASTERQPYGHASFHWAIIVEPKRGGEGHLFDVDDRGANGWVYRRRVGYSANSSKYLLAMMMIGKVPREQRSETLHLDKVCSSIPLPRLYSYPEENCVHWMQRAILELQRNGYAELFDIDTFMDDAASFAASCLRNGRAKVRKNYVDNRKFP
ncbi:hypothetical protein M501DRAFT_1017649 [Patellaria atrata CBS 101060]|uniref:Uncharacterized protein n=1 Tax=Patellaria atrata CBS 101060 TaxID=1346257 RepID=A0A9P4S8K0_9PEZI|nr:hypothetical protein M501DRAFT_1017649 [Patellaria atrata CBS 101060]